MSSKENEVAVEKIADNDKAADGKCEIKGTKRPAEVSVYYNIARYTRPVQHDAIVLTSATRASTGARSRPVRSRIVRCRVFARRTCVPRVFHY